MYFFFGPAVFVPKDNVLISNEQCLKIGILSTIADHASLVQGSSISYEAVVETDFNITTNYSSISINVRSYIL